jgi:hypothetical protein
MILQYGIVPNLTMPGRLLAGNSENHSFLRPSILHIPSALIRAHPLDPRHPRSLGESQGLLTFCVSHLLTSL